MSVGRKTSGCAERPQRDVVGRPRADAGQREQRARVRRRGRRRGRARRRRRRAPRTGATRARPRARGIGSDSGSSPASVAALGKRWRRARRAVGRRPARRRAVLGRRAGRATVRAPATRDLLAEHGADRDLVAVDVAGHPQAGVAPAPVGPSTGSPAKRVADRDRVAVGVEQPAARARRRRATSRRSASREGRGTNAVDRLVGGRRGQPTVPGPCGSAQRARVRRRRSTASTPGTARARGSRSSARPANGVRTASRSCSVPPAATPRAATAAQLRSASQA